MIRIKEIVSRSEQGRTKPFICRTIDDSLYFVKGRPCDAKCMILEWVAGHLGLELGLPIPEFDTVEIPWLLASNSKLPEAGQLGWAWAFGSKQVEFADELDHFHIEQVNSGLAVRIMVFDWWVANYDRSFEEANPNALWTEPTTLHIIDHNNTFRKEAVNTSWEEFCKSHIFGSLNTDSLWGEAPQDLLEIVAKRLTGNDRTAVERFASDCQTALAKVPRIWQNMPSAWQHECPSFSVREVNTILERAQGVLW